MKLAIPLIVVGAVLAIALDYPAGGLPLCAWGAVRGASRAPSTSGRRPPRRACERRQRARSRV